MAITPEEVKQAARQARLRITSEEAELFTGQLNDILGYAQSFSCLNTDNVKPLFHVFSKQNVWREDEAGSSLPREKALENAPDTFQGFFRVPKIIE